MQMHSWMNRALGVVRQEDKLQFESFKPAAEASCSKGLGASAKKQAQVVLQLCQHSCKLYMALLGARTNDTFDSNVHKYQINKMQIS